MHNKNKFIERFLTFLSECDRYFFAKFLIALVVARIISNQLQAEEQVKITPPVFLGNIVSAIKIQRAYRLYRYRHAQMSPRSYDEESLISFLGKDLYEKAKSLNVTTCPQYLSDRSILDTTRAEQWINAHPQELRSLAHLIVSKIKRISFEEFIHRLRITIKAFNEKLMQLPKDYQDYVIILGQAPSGDSNAWVLSLALPFLAKAPINIIPTNRRVLGAGFSELVNTLEKNPNLNVALYLDDAIFSGNQTSETLDRLMMPPNSSEHFFDVQRLNIFIAAPYILLNTDTYCQIKYDTEYYQDNNVTLKPRYVLPHIPLLPFKSSFFSEKEQMIYRNAKDLCAKGEMRSARQMCSTFFEHKRPELFSVVPWIAYGSFLHQTGQDWIPFVSNPASPYPR